MYSKNIKLVLIFIFVWILEIFISKGIEKTLSKQNKYYNKLELEDTGFKLLPKIDLKYNYIDDLMICLLVIPLFFYNINTSKFLQVIIITRILRLICMQSTILPSPDSKCEEYLDRKEKIIGRYYKIIFGRCNETIFSGHVSFMLTCVLFLLPFINSIMKIFLYIYAIITSLVVISLRNHYSIDVVLAWIITIPIYIINTNCNIKKLLPNM